MTCSDGAWLELWQSWHRNPHANLYMPRVALDEVIECHPKAVFIIKGKVAPTAKEVLVDRDKMWDFLLEHGAVCGQSNEGQYQRRPGLERHPQRG